MPAKDRYHENLKNALIKDGWTVTDDPFHLKWGKKDLYVDLAAEKLLIAEKGTQKIAVDLYLAPGDWKSRLHSRNPPPWVKNLSFSLSPRRWTSFV
ncbi:MAG: element excision factor XisH family protein [Nostoc sp.]|uniref:element excision factor XisH family protein n=1 Tax=Nostoc sp. TaxID=1180 RepID=UPI002FF4EE0F